MSLEKPNFYEIYIMQDSTELYVKRYEFGWSMFCMTVGGLAYFWKNFLGFLVHVFTYPLMVNTILGRLFFMKNNRDPEAEVSEEEIDEIPLKK